ASAMSLASFLVMTVTDSFGNRTILPPRDRYELAASVERDVLDRVEVHEGLVIVRDGLDLRGAREREVALGLEHEEAGRHTRGEFLFLGLELLLLQFARRAGGADALLVGLHLTGGGAHLCGHLHLEVLHLRLRLVVLQARARKVCVRGARP